MQAPLPPSVSSPNLYNQPVLVIEVPREFIDPATKFRYLDQPTQGMQMKKKLSLPRLKYIGQVLIIYTNREQVYFADRLDIPHYQVAALDLPKYLKTIADDKNSSDTEVIHLRSHADHHGPHLNVFNTLSLEMEAIAQRMPLQELAKAVLLSSKTDSARGNLFIDTGFCSDRNSRRSAKFGGVAVPNELCRSREQMFLDAKLGMTEMVDLCCPPEMKGKVFFDPERNKEFSGDLIGGNRVEALRVALTNEEHLVDCHADDKNDVTEHFQGVITYSKWLLLSDGDSPARWWRLTIIGYSRKSIAGAFRRRDRYMPLVERVVEFYNDLPDERKYITPAILQFKEPSVTVKPHTNKCVFYSIYVDCLSRLQVFLNLSVWHVLALLHNTIISETPDYFVTVTTTILGSSGDARDRFTNLCPIDMGVAFYRLVFKLKEDRRSCRTPVVGQRHQPHYNVKQSDGVVARSIHNIFRLYKAMDHLDHRLACDGHFFSRAVSYLEDGYMATGVFGAGGLTAQHLIHIGVLCGLFPGPLMSHAEIGKKTHSYKYLSKREGLDDHKEDTRQVLACLCTRLGITAAEAENLVCKYSQDNTDKIGRPKAKASPYRDSLYLGQHLFNLDRHFRLVATTESSSGIVDFIETRCCPLDPRHAVPEVDAGPGYWALKVKPPGRLNPLKDGTRKYIKAKREAEEEAIRRAELSSKHRFRIRISLIGLKRSADSSSMEKNKENNHKRIASVTRKPPSLLGEFPTHGAKRRQRLSLVELPLAKTDSSYMKQQRSRVTEWQIPRRIPLATTTVGVIVDEPTPNKPIPPATTIMVDGRIPVALATISIPPSTTIGVANMTQKPEEMLAHDNHSKPIPVKPIPIKPVPPMTIIMVDEPIPVTATTELGRDNLSLDEFDFDLFSEFDLDAKFSSLDCLDKFDMANGASALDLNPGDSTALVKKTSIMSAPSTLVSLPLQHFAMVALCLPQYRTTFLKHRTYRPQNQSRSSTMHYASVHIPESNDSCPNSVWQPPADSCPKFIETFFPGSLVAPDGVRYHETKVLATRYCLMCSILSSRLGMIESQMATKYKDDLTLFYLDVLQKGKPPSAPCALLSKDANGLLTFSFLNPMGDFVGNRICQQNGSHVIW
jgi:hypothetical protein